MLFVAITCTLTVTVGPTSAACTTYALEVAPPIETQFWPIPSQRSHWYAYAVAGSVDQVPCDAVSVEPTSGTPEGVIAGTAVLIGATFW